MSPVHVAIIMDGNGRWAKARGLPRAAGHQRGAEVVRDVVIACRDLGISYLTLYAFSSENWKRPPTEVGDLMELLCLYLEKEVAELNRNDVRVRVIGDRSRLPENVRALISNAEVHTRHNQALTMILAVNYGGRSEIVNAVHAIAEAVQAGRLAPAEITEDLFASYLDTGDIPDPDLLIRTSGERRMSNFLSWQSVYTELVFMDTLWPDFSRENLLAALDEYYRRERRYGASSFGG
jgi:undecaprenyl diphosphate synthase